MKTKTIAVFLALALPAIVFGQDLKTNVFVRTPQVVNYNFEQKEINLNSVLSIGAGLSHRTSFIELATFIGDSDIYGFYTFFGKTLKTQELGQNWNLYTNWFGEFTYIPNQKNTSDIFISTSGLCFFLNYGFDWGSIGLPLCIGAAYSQETISLNTRAIINVSIQLN